MEEVVTAELVNRWEPEGSPASGLRDIAWEWCGPDSWRTWLAVHQGAGKCCGVRPRELIEALSKTNYFD